MVSTSPRAPGGSGDRRLRCNAFWQCGRPTGRAVALCLAVALVAIARPVRAQAGMSLADRVAGRLKVEDIYWAHRIWPRENPGPKPPRTAVLSNEQIAQRVEESLRYEAALGTIWHHALTPAVIQAELERIVRQSQQPEVLDEIIAALGRDPYQVAECLVRPELAERRIKEWYANDRELHASVREQAERELLAAHGIDDLRAGTGEVAEIEWLRKAPGGSDERLDAQRIALTEESWNRRAEALVRAFPQARPLPVPVPEGRGGAAERLAALPLGSLSALQEDGDRYYAVMLLARGEGAMRQATVTWRKQPFATWWGTLRQAIGPAQPEAAAYTLGAQSGSGVAVEHWRRLAGSFALDPRWYHSAVWTGIEMIVWGGADGYAVINAGRYNPVTDSWMEVSTAGAGATTGVAATAVWTGREMIVWGGISGETGGRYDPSTDRWVAISKTNAPSWRYHHTAVWTGKEMIVWGGDDYSKGFDTGGRYSPATDTWKPTATAGAPSARSSHTAVWTGSEMIVWGGSDFTPGGFLDSGARYRPATDTWLPAAPAGASSGRNNDVAVWTGSEMIVWGGFNSSGPLSTGLRYNPATDQWLATATAGAPSARVETTAVWTGSEMIVWGGSPSFNGGALGTGGRYRPATDRWEPTSLTRAPVARTFHTAVWTGSEMIVWGGWPDLNGSFLVTGYSGGRYRPATDSWVDLAVTSAPRARVFHTAVWTGSEMIVWGGAVATNTGSRYTPATDSWLATTTSDAPAERSSHTAVWTGSKMIVWGGSGSSQASDHLATGGLYDPATDQWAATSTANAPDARFGHVAVWTGREMIVWGGGPYGWGLVSGGRYDPAADTWVATNTNAAPSARSSPAAVWTGSEMIVWGGRVTTEDCSQCPTIVTELDTGRRYDPATDTWSRVTRHGAPVGRDGHVAVWTGSQMIVWGGEDAAGSGLDSGGRYDPATNIWTATARAGAPTARGGATAVWTGSEMIVWGGTDSNGHPLKTGGLYDPAADRWRGTTTRGSPAARSLHTAVWTGSRMIVWGGTNSTSYVLGNGGAYAPGKVGAGAEESAGGSARGGR
jgi:N-acetylneuraminic acid mutarotase